MSLEGRLRDLGLPEVCQLLSSSRKTGTLRVQAPLQACAAEIRFANGVITDAAQWPVESTAGEVVWERTVPPVADARTLESCVLDLLAWTDGDFRFHAEKSSVRANSPIRVTVEPLLVEAAQRAEVWDRVRDRVPHARVVPAFIDIEPQQLPSLRLVPQEWEVLTRVDGRRTVSELATVLGRNLLDVVEIVYALIGARVLALRDHESAPRRHPTPPSQAAIGESSMIDDRLRTPSMALAPADAPDVVTSSTQLLQAASTLVFPDVRVPATSVSVLPDAESADTSILFADNVSVAASSDALALCRAGDDAARVGDLAGALSMWSAALRIETGVIDADRVREAIALAARLHAMLQQGAGACRS